MLPSCVPLTRVQACVGVEGHWTAPSPQHGQRRVGECVARKGSGPAARSAGLLSGVARREPAVRGSAEPAGPQGGGATAMSTPGLGGRLPQPGQWGAEPPRRSSPHCPSLLAACEVCVLCASGACHPVSTRMSTLLSASGSLEPHAQQICGRAWLGPFWPECRGTSASPGTWGWPLGEAGHLAASQAQPCTHQPGGRQALLRQLLAAAMPTAAWGLAPRLGVVQAL